MCLYETKIKNPHYLENEKNKGVPPRLKDWRKEYIKVGCGWCEECRKKIAAEWRIRLLEEFKDNQNAEFVTLSFAPKQIEKLEKEIHEKKYRGIEGDETDVNILASYSIRMFTERWRKKYHYAPRHYFITELGHEKSERLHIHGIIWHPKWIWKGKHIIGQPSKKEIQKDIEEKWMYGNVYIGEYVNERTMNYVTKYITKTDNYHKGFKPRTFVSKGLGEGYIERIGLIVNKYNGENTYTKYRTEKGYTYELPRYYKNKLYTEEQKDYLWTLQLDKEIIYLNKTPYNIYEDDEQTRHNFKQLLTSKRENSKRAGYGDGQTINKKYIITDLMKLDYKGVINYDKSKLIKCTQRREIKRTIQNNEENKELSKDYKVTKYIYGQYCGTTTESERKYNQLIKEAEQLRITIRKLRLIKKGIIDEKTLGNKRGRRKNLAAILAE